MNSLQIIGINESPEVRANLWLLQHQMLSAHCNRYFAGRTKKLEVLEAGCGRLWHLKLEQPMVLTGVDQSEEALAIRRRQVGDLDAAVHGDLNTVSLPDAAFDLIYCAYVLEHLHGAEQTLDRFLKCLKPGGLAVLLFPDRDSVFGLLTRLTPLWFHRFYQRRILGFADAGKPGHGPFPTVYDPVVSRRGFHAFCRSRGVEIMLEFGEPLQAATMTGRKGGLIAAGVRGLSRLSLGRLAHAHQNLAYIIRKPG